MKISMFVLFPEGAEWRSHSASGGGSPVVDIFSRKSHRRIDRVATLESGTELVFLMV